MPPLPSPECRATPYRRGSGARLDIEIPPERSQLSRLRDTTRSFIVDHRSASAEHVADVLLVVSELATNVLRHSPGHGQLTVIPGPDGTEIRVSDDSRRLPELQPCTSGRTSGRGLIIVSRVSSTVEVRLDPHGGKTISAYVTDPAALPAVRPHTARPPGACR